MRLQLIRYESVELTEQLMRERQSRQAEEDEDGGQSEGQELEGGAAGAAPPELQVELRGVLLENAEESAEEPTISTVVVGGQEEGMLYVLTGGLSQTGEDSSVLHLQDTAQQQEVQTV